MPDPVDAGPIRKLVDARLGDGNTDKDAPGAAIDSAVVTPVDAYVAPPVDAYVPPDTPDH